MLDLNRFTQETRAIVPIVGGRGQYKGRKIYAPKSIKDGFYNVTLKDKVRIEKKASPMEVLKTLKPLPKYRIYALGTEGVPTNFDIFRRAGLGESEAIEFLNLPPFSVAEVVPWEDGRLYFYNEILPKNRTIIREVARAFERRAILSGLRGISPEIRYYVLLLNLQRDSYEALAELKDWTISDEERNRRIKSFRGSFLGRLKNAVTQAGGTFIGYSKVGRGQLVEWEIGGQRVKSTIRDDFRIVTAGFCLSGDDKLHTLPSLINLAKLFQQEYPLYITRE